jgi:thiol-disulfide isomerase/thioredoxin
MLAVALSLTAGTSLAAENLPKEVKQYFKLSRKASSQMQSGRYYKAAKTLERIVALAPESDSQFYNLACARARLGDPDAAFAALDRAFANGRSDADYIKTDDDLAALRDDPRFDDLIERIEAWVESEPERNRTFHDIPDPADAEAFDSAGAIAEAFDARLAELDRYAPLTSWELRWDKRVAVLNDKLGALERYLVDHPDTDDREAAQLQTVRTAIELRQGWRYWRGDAPLIIANAERFLDEQPDSEHLAEVELARAVATWKNYGRESAAESLDDRIAAAGPLFEQVAAVYPDTAEGGKAGVWRLAVGYEKTGRDVTPELTALFQEIDATFEDDDELADYAWTEAPEVMFQMEGRRSFDVVDLDGNHWSWDELEGKVFLIDFWATWCGPCIGEIPHMKEAYERYHDQGFEIVGVSLDDIDREAFEAECAEKEISWAQVHDGEGWENEIARTFHISGIPTPVLVGRDGRVVAVDGDARGSNLIESVGELIANSTAATEAASP